MEFTYEQVIYATILTSLAGFSTAIGAVIVFFFRNDNLRILSFGLGFSAGVMIYVSFMGILPSSLEDFKKLYHSQWAEFLALLCFFGGFFISAIIDRLIPEDLNPHEPKKDFKQLKICPLLDPSQKPPTPSINSKALKRTGVFTAIAIAIHNFPEGFATFISSLESVSFGMTIAIAVGIHNIPEGMAVSLPIYHATKNKKKAFIYSCLSGIAEPLGAIVGAFFILPFMNEASLAIVFGIVAGIMVFISFDELLPSARLYGKTHDSLYGLVLGMAIMGTSLILINH